MFWWSLLTSSSDYWDYSSQFPRWNDSCITLLRHNKMLLWLRKMAQTRKEANDCVCVFFLTKVKLFLREQVIFQKCWESEWCRSWNHWEEDSTHQMDWCSLRLSWNILNSEALIAQCQLYMYIHKYIYIYNTWRSIYISVTKKANQSDCQHFLVCVWLLILDTLNLGVEAIQKRMPIEENIWSPRPDRNTATTTNKNTEQMDHMLPSGSIRCGDIKGRSVEVCSPPTASATDRQPPLGLWIQPARRIMNCVLSFPRWRRGSERWICQFYANLPFEGAMFKMSRGDLCNACQCPTYNEQPGWKPTNYIRLDQTQ